MRHSIRYKFTMIFIGLTAFVLLAAWCVNNLFLESFYLKQKMQTLTEAYNSINHFTQEGKGNTEEMELILRKYSDNSNIAMLVIDSNNSAIFTSAADWKLLRQKLQSNILDLTSATILESHDNYTIQKVYDRQMQSYYMESWGFLNDNTIFIMRTPLAGIEESASISNRFLAYVGLVAVIVSSICMLLITRKITEPILELSVLSERMSNLDFDAKYMGDAEDEVGILGASMNSMSDKLEGTISELKSANIQLRKDIEEKNQIDEMRIEFLSNVSHELKTPIALIQGYAEGLQEGMCDDKESKDFYCDVIMDEANKMNTMVKQLLTLSALEFGNDSISIERFDIVSLIQGIIDSASILIRQKNVIVVFEHRDPIFVWADEFKIEEVVTNYVSNALNHVSGENEIIINLQENEQVIRISVFNTGDRIPQEDLNKVWIKFYKVDKARTREYGGSGIGLSIVQAIMDAHQREYGVKNWVNGVEFWFELDCSKKI